MGEDSGKKPDWEFWLRMPNVKVWQACALSLGIDPDSMKHDRNSWMLGGSGGPIFESGTFENDAEKTEFYKRLRLLMANLHDRDHFSPGVLNTRSAHLSELRFPEFAAWTLSIGWTIPEELAKLAVPDKEREGARSMKPDYEKWKKTDLWTIYEGAWLVAGTEPPEGGNVDAFDTQPGGCVADEIYGHAKNAIDVGKLEVISHRMPPLWNQRVKPSAFIAWLIERADFEVPPELLELASQTDRPLTTRERDTLLKLIIGMAVKGYGYDPTAARNEATSEITKDLDELGIGLDADTVRAKLKEGADLLKRSGTS